MFLCLSVVLAAGTPWSVERAPVLAPPWKVQQSWKVSASRLAVIGQAPDPPATETSPARHRQALFIASPLEGPRLLLEAGVIVGRPGSPSSIFTREANRWAVALITPALTLLPVGTFDDQPTAVACRRDGFPCVAATEQGLVYLPDAKTRRVLDDDSQFEDVTVSPEGRFVSAAQRGALMVYDTRTGAGAFLQGRLLLAARTLTAARARIAADASLAPWADGSLSECRTTAARWLGPTLLAVTVDVIDDGEMGGPIEVPGCPAQAFTVDAVTLARASLARPPRRDPEDGPEEQPGEGPWAVVPCPQGGWRRRAGPALLTPCRATDSRMGRPRREDKVLPEALTLSEDTLAVFGARHREEYTWFLGSRREPSARVFLEGPSVVRVTTQGVTIQPIDWPFDERTHFLWALEDDWHLVSMSLVDDWPPHSSAVSEPLFLRLRQQ
jgi:hypothetical protein